METLFIPTENDFKRWIKEAVIELLNETKSFQSVVREIPEPLISRKEIASFLNISLVTLHDWVKRGLPYHKKRGRVYFIRSEVLDHIKISKSET